MGMESQGRNSNKDLYTPKNRRQTQLPGADDDFFSSILEVRNQVIDTSKLKIQKLPFKPPPRVKPAFNSPYKESNGKGPILHKHFNYDLSAMRTEKQKDGDDTWDYKSFAKWSLSFDREETINELVVKRRLEDDKVETGYSKAAREYLWNRMTEAIFTEEPIKFYSIQMKKYYAPPEIQAHRVDPNLKGIAARQTVQIGDESFVIPDTYEKEKWIKKKNGKQPEELKVKLEQIKANPIIKELTAEEKRDLKYHEMFETLKDLTKQDRDF